MIGRSDSLINLFMSLLRSSCTLATLLHTALPAFMGMRNNLLLISEWITGEFLVLRLLTLVVTNQELLCLFADDRLDRLPILNDHLIIFLTRLRTLTSTVLNHKGIILKSWVFAVIKKFIER